MDLTFKSLSETEPGHRWRQIFASGWLGWRAWFLARGGDEDPSLKEAERELKRHMPEMVPVWRRLVDLVGGEPDAARFLTFWRPPRYLVNCSQAVLVDDDGPLLIRNYDLDPTLNEATVYRSAWKGRAVMGMVEGMSGLADGLNEHGLAASLTFGGRTNVGPGFGVPMIVRYVLETCTETDEALEVLRRVPSHMSYNVTVVDRGGRFATVYLAPDRPTIVTRNNWATNHQIGVEWPRHARISRTVERERHLKALLGEPRLDRSRLAEDFLRAPLYSRDYAKGFGTVYTALYRPVQGEMSVLWPERDEWRHAFADFTEAERRVSYPDVGAHGSAAAWRERLSQAGFRLDDTAAQWGRFLPEGFLETLTRNMAEPDGADWTRLAAFWRRDNVDRDEDWINLNRPDAR